MTTPGAPMLYMGDEFGQHGGADPDNRRMLDFNLNEGQQDLKDFTSEIANVRLENEALRRGVYSTFHAESDLLAYEMTSDEQSLLVVLNRGGANQLQSPYDEVIFGDSTLSEGTLSVLADSVTILAKSADETDSNTGNSSQVNGNNTDNTTGNNSGNNDTQVDNSTTENQTQEVEMRTCNGCCGDTFEVPIDEPCPMVSCAPCNEDSNDTASSSVDSIIRNSLIAIVFVAVLVFIQMSRRSEDNH